MDRPPDVRTLSRAAGSIWQLGSLKGDVFGAIRPPRQPGQYENVLPSAQERPNATSRTERELSLLDNLAEIGIDPETRVLRQPDDTSIRPVDDALEVLSPLLNPDKVLDHRHGLRRLRASHVQGRWHRMPVRDHRHVVGGAERANVPLLGNAPCPVRIALYDADRPSFEQFLDLPPGMHVLAGR